MIRNHTDSNGTKKRPGWWGIVRIIGFGIGGIFLAALFALLLGIVVQWLWNWLMPDIFGLKQITFWQAVGLLFLSKLLFGGLRHHHGPPHPRKRLSRDRTDHWRQYKRFWEEEESTATDDPIEGAVTGKSTEMGK
jgi:hypothetical protein